ncbi:MAG: hypothetical protein LBT46_07880 [Planctomycetaceae bacterium]|jgi:t-SNARE complex subunit (syntaxin)|nr:hypothetical protein [Planctomycetaceae bacterium]
MGGDALWEGQKAFTEEYINFFQNPEVRKNLRVITDKMNNALSRMQQVFTKRTEKMDKEIDKAVTEFENQLDGIGNGSTNLPELPE